VVKEPSIRVKFESAGQTIVGGTPDALCERAVRDRERVDVLVKRIGPPLRRRRNARSPFRTRLAGRRRVVHR